ncbi:Hypothetical_protein [Hexamita inflata]|uniref:Hypothetical_protein n=1 Tax=Hexamita inflata TaxID=28002 RepID=A0ABP1GIQ8_9EUKA
MNKQSITSLKGAADSTQDIVLAVVVGCVVGFYFISFCIVGCTRHSLRMQQVATTDEKKKDNRGIIGQKNQNRKQSMDIGQVFAQKPDGPMNDSVQIASFDEKDTVKHNMQEHIAENE